MLRMLPPSRLVLLACLPILCSGCGTIYSDTYSHRRNYFVAPAPKKEATAADKKALEDAAAKLEASKVTTPAPATSGIPGMEPLPPAPAAEMGGAAPAPEGAAPPLPGL